MEIIEGLSKLRRKFKSGVVALGTFDGVHCGHQQVIKTTQDVARRQGRTSVVVTFQPLPRAIIGKKKREGRINYNTGTKGRDNQKSGH